LSMVDRICELAQKKGLSIAALEKAVGLSNGIIGKWKKQSPSCDKLKLVADYLNTTIDYLLTGIKNELKQNEIEMLEIFQNFSDREQIKIIGRMEEWLEVKHQREAIAQKQRIVGVQVARRTDGKFVKEPITAEEFEKIEALPEDTDY